jgi:uncharacterized membrane protein HdeD (DUF308 family)
MLANHWITVAQRGLACAAFCVMALFGPERSLAWFAPLLLFYAMADGVLAIAAAARAAYKRDRWAGFLLEGATGVLGVVAVGLWPGLSLPSLTWGAAFWTDIIAIGALIESARLGTAVTRDWLLAAGGVALARLGLVAVGSARAGLPAVARWCAVSALLFAVLFVTLGFWRRYGRGRGAFGHGPQPLAR